MKPKVEWVKVEWAEGYGELDGKEFSCLESLERKIAQISPPPKMGYNKHKIHIRLSSGETIIHRYDYGDKDPSGKVITLREDVRSAMGKHAEKVDYN